MADEKREQAENAFMQWWKAKLGPEELGWPYETSYFAFHAGHAALAAARSEWVDVADRLPEKPLNCLLTVRWHGERGRMVVTDIWSPLVGWDGDDPARTVIAWCERPQPYQRPSREGE